MQRAELVLPPDADQGLEDHGDLPELLRLEDPHSQHPADRLLEESWTARQRRASRRELRVETLAAGAFVLIAGPLALQAGRLDAGLALALVGLYALVAGTIRFPVGAGYVVPTYLILVPMLLLLPPAVVPLLAAFAWVVASLGRLICRRGRPEHVLFAIPNAWHALGPALVLWLVGRPHGTLATVVVYLGAFVAGCLVDLAVSTAREAGSLMIAPQVQLRVTVQVWLIDACIAPLGLLLARSAQHNPLELGLVVPLTGLLLLLHRDRSAKILQAQHRLELASTDPLTRLGNRRKLATELIERVGMVSMARPLVLMVFDLDGFKGYNDTFGHLAGDALLGRLAGKLAAVVGQTGTAYRLGGDEFCALMSAQPEELPDLAAAAAGALREDGERFSIGASWGAVVLPHETLSPDYALQLADERMYARKREQRPEAAREQTRDVLIRIMQAKQPGLNEHSSEVSRLAVAVGQRLALDIEQIDELARAADLHDIGKVGIPDAILEKPGTLTEEEWDLVRQHTILGERILSAASALRPVARIVRASHERWDGDGYPDGLAGESIPLAARILAACDAYDAIISDRCYRPARPPASAREELIREAGHQFDPVVVGAVLEELDRASATPAQDALRPVMREVADRVLQVLG